jgi:hypothetical protein
MKTDTTSLIISPSIILRMRNISGNICREIQNPHFVFSKSPPPPRKSCPLRINAEKYATARQVTDGNTVHADCLLHTYD